MSDFLGKIGIEYEESDKKENSQNNSLHMLKSVACLHLKND